MTIRSVSAALRAIISTVVARSASLRTGPRSVTMPPFVMIFTFLASAESESSSMSALRISCSRLEIVRPGSPDRERASSLRSYRARSRRCCRSGAPSRAPPGRCRRWSPGRVALASLLLRAPAASTRRSGVTASGRYRRWCLHCGFGASASGGAVHPGSEHMTRQAAFCLMKEGKRSEPQRSCRPRASGGKKVASPRTRSNSRAAQAERMVWWWRSDERGVGRVVRNDRRVDVGRPQIGGGSEVTLCREPLAGRFRRSTCR